MCRKLIKTITKRGDIEVSGLTTCTSEIGVFRCNDTKWYIGGKRLVLVDTPGFGNDMELDEGGSDGEVLGIIADWLEYMCV